MFNGTVILRALITSNGLKFPSCEFNPHIPGVEKVIIESLGGQEILSTVHLLGVTSEEEGRALADKVIITALDRIAFQYSSTIEASHITSSRFDPVNPPPGACVRIQTGDLIIVGEQANLILGIPAAAIKSHLEAVTTPGEQFYGFYRSALQSKSQVEKFMHLYNLLLMFFQDNQGNVDGFIRSQDPTVPESPSPKFPGVMETIYTRLRNEFAHRRPGVNMQNTKTEMEQHVGALIGLVKQAIAAQP